MIISETKKKLVYINNYGKFHSFIMLFKEIIKLNNRLEQKEINKDEFIESVKLIIIYIKERFNIY